MSKYFFKKNDVYSALLVKNRVSIHDIQFYIACGLNIHPMLYNDYIETLCELERQKRISFTPSMVFKLFTIKHRNIPQMQNKKAKQQ